jgi:hypothetical protein
VVLETTDYVFSDGSKKKEFALALPQTPNANLIENPSFEDGPKCPGGRSWCVVDQQSVPGWQSYPDGKIELDVKVWRHHDGAVSIDLAHYRPYVLHQVVKLVVGQVYKLNFALMKHPRCGNGKGFYNIAPETQSIKSSSGRVAFTGGRGWDVKEVEFTAASEMTRIEFGSLSGGSCGPIIDNIALVSRYTSIPQNVSLTAIPNTGPAKYGIVEESTVLWKSGGYTGEIPISFHHLDHKDCNVINAMMKEKFEGSCCEQNGITCDKDYRVTSMYVNSCFNLLLSNFKEPSSVIPESIGELTELESIILWSPSGGWFPSLI